ncbi:ATP-binding cassette domain-containing protein [Agrobacterium vitis]|uniref:ABC transporter ATP-binding protein n=1 Tax=Agrobacterium vitis TaxID=373 RepID=UPI0012E77EC9|nr:ABC transporter ATP-binding protein [Agrobacterium vitis]MVA81671.1 ATP-binding cassette domain-containing protein [Agrobacterium vitis]
MDQITDKQTVSGRVRLGARGVTRRFGALTANDHVDFSALTGTIHAIVGGNGAGKSTLMRILQGMDQPDAGSVIVNDAAIRLSGPAEAFSLGIGMVHQEFMLVPGLTLLENLVLAHEPVKGLGVIDRAKALDVAHALERQAGVTLDWTLQADDAPVHVRQIVEILRLLYRGADVLILDEPTAVLAPSQIRELMALLRRLRDGGHTILFISHKLDEVMTVSDDITIMRSGKVIRSIKTAETTRAQLAELMIGEILHQTTARAGQPGDVVLAIESVSVGDGRGDDRLKNASFDVRKGEIVAVAGVAGNGQDELVAVVTGLMRARTGTLSLLGKDMSCLPLPARRALGLSYLSPDRAAEGLCLEASIAENAVAGHHHWPGLVTSGILKLGAIANHAEKLLDRYSVKCASPKLAISSLSGGNQQRVAIARELDGDPDLLVACQPTRGVDIKGIAFIHQCLLDYRDRGGAVLLVSEELDEILTLADRILVLYNGEMRGELARGHADVESVGRMMLGEAA